MLLKKSIIKLIVLLIFTNEINLQAMKNNTNDKFYPRLKLSIEKAIADSNKIGAERKAQLQELGHYLAGKINQDELVQLVFICTHNSRRSHLGQLWMHAASAYHGIESMKTFSGGTEATAFNHNAVEALIRAGFDIQKQKEEENPLYIAKYGPADEGLQMFSKVYDGAANPKTNFSAVMVCSHADENCPFIPGADKRFVITYEDPKVSDGTGNEEKVYSERSDQIAREMLYVMGIVKSKMNQ